MNEQIVEAIRPDDVAEFLNNHFPDENMRSLLFASLSLSRRNLRGPQPLLRMVYMGALLCYIYWKNNKESFKDDSENYFRIDELCNSLYKENTFNLESSIYLLFLIRNDVKENPNSLFISCLNKDEECEYGKIYGLLDEWSSSSERILVYYKNYHVLNFLISITNNLRILTEAKLNIEQGQVSFTFADKSYSFDKYLKYVEDAEYFCLLTKEENEYFDLKNLTRV